MAKRQLTATSKLLISLLAVGDAFSIFFPTPKQFHSMALRGSWKSYSSYKSTLFRMYKRGWIKFVNKNNIRFIKITKKGRLHALLNKITTSKPSASWSGHWWLVMWDVPEESKQYRHHLRSTLKKAGFRQLQASVFISPHEVSREAMDYLIASKLINYIRIAKVQEMDNDKDLRKQFNLNF